MQKIQSSPPKEIYLERLKQLRSLESKCDLQSVRYANLRLGIFVLGIAFGIVNYNYHFIPTWSLLTFIVLFFIAVYFHDLINKKIKKTKTLIKLYNQGVERLEFRWMGKGQDGLGLTSSIHKYYTDLDIFGKGSLFELICSAQTYFGRKKLADWLTSFAPRPTVVSRQQAVTELRENLDLRENLATIVEESQKSKLSKKLITWGAAEPHFNKNQFLIYRSLTWLLTTAAILSFSAIFFTKYGLSLFFAVVILEFLFYKVVDRKLNPILVDVNFAYKELNLFSGICKQIEDQQFKSEFLNNLKAQLSNEKSTASILIGNLEGLVVWLDARRNQIAGLIAYVLMWHVHFGFSIETWRQRHGRNISKWLDSLAEFEAINSVAGYAYENPKDPFPCFVDQGPFFKGEELGHPLIEVEKNVRNSITLDKDIPIWIVSGSNMSGKSTFLRAIGINLVLANLGAPVRAKNLSLSSLNLASEMRIMDSLQEGESRFYAEIKEIHNIIEKAKESPPLLFLMDEILSGTNSHDRLVGAQAIIQRLFELGAIGLVTTHDLALTKISDKFPGHIKNVHFADEFRNGKLNFDYCLKPGVVKNSNAISLMKSVGIEFNAPLG